MDRDGEQSGSRGGAARRGSLLAAVALGRSRRRTSPFVWLAALGLVALVVLGLGGIGLQSLPRPFAQEQVDRSPPPLLQALQDLSRYQGATGSFQVVVDVERDVDNVPSILAGERTLFLAQGTVDGYVELGGLGPESVQVGPDRSVQITLPPATLSEARVDPEQSRVVSRQRGVLDRVGGAFSDNPTSERELYLRAEERMVDAAAQSDLRRRTEDNTRSMLTGLVKGLGYSDVTVTFTPDSRP